MKIAVLLTCFNRKTKTLSCLKGLFQAQSIFNHKSEEHIESEVFLTDDGCTDGTAQAVKEAFAGKNACVTMEKTRINETAYDLWYRGRSGLVCNAWNRGTAGTSFSGKRGKHAGYGDWQWQ